MKDVISIVIPVYNVAAYLPECLESILSQDYEKLEIILIDDGSTDVSGEVCDRYAGRDQRIRVIHQKNGGAAAAKNAGLRVATGEYLSFVDSDDYLEPGAYSHMVRTLRETGADAGEFSFRHVFRNRAEDYIPFQGRTVIDGEAYMTLYTKGWHSALLWNKLYRRSLFDGIFFEEGHRIDDEYFTYQGMMRAGKVVRDDRIVYNYRRRASGAMLNPKSREQLMFDRVDYMEKRRKKVAEELPGLRKTFDVDFLDAMIYMSEYPENSAESLKRIKTAVWVYFREGGNTLPPRYLWRGLLRVLVTPEGKLLARCAQPSQNADQSEYFP